MKREELLLFIKTEIAAETDCAIEQISETDTFHSFGLDSLSSITILNKLEDEFNLDLNPIYFWDYPTLGAFADFLLKEHIH